MTERQEGALALVLAPALPAAYAADRLGLTTLAAVLIFLVLHDRSGS
ncbi:hypothetical protein [uncultured Oscillibacter sp.]|nr:hypothetical protein [uncultured Oscillibacter sp.]